MQKVEHALLVLVLNFRIRNCSLTSRTPVHWVVVPVDEPLFVHLKERYLSLHVVLGLHGDVLVAPVHRKAQSPHRAAHVLDVGQCELLTQLSELCSGHLALCYAVCLLYLHLGGQTMAVPSLREHHIIAPHTLVSGYEIYVAPV